MNRLTIDQLINAYTKAKKLKLDPRFIEQLENELKKRFIDINAIE